MDKKIDILNSRDYEPQRNYTYEVSIESNKLTDAEKYDLTLASNKVVFPEVESTFSVGCLKMYFVDFMGKNIARSLGKLLGESFKVNIKMFSPEGNFSRGVVYDTAFRARIDLGELDSNGREIRYIGLICSVLIGEDNLL